MKFNLTLAGIVISPTASVATNTFPPRLSSPSLEPHAEAMTIATSAIERRAVLANTHCHHYTIHNFEIHTVGHVIGGHLKKFPIARNDSHYPVITHCNFGGFFLV